MKLLRKLRETMFGNSSVPNINPRARVFGNYYYKAHIEGNIARLPSGAVYEIKPNGQWVRKDKVKK